MNTQSAEYQELVRYGKNLIGIKAQSTMLNMAPAKTITGFKIVPNGVYADEPILMVTLGGQSVYEFTLRNI